MPSAAVLNGASGHWQVEIEKMCFQNAPFLELVKLAMVSTDHQFALPPDRPVHSAWLLLLWIYAREPFAPF
jgi:hypothetical protein